MILAADIYYYADTAQGAMILFDHWEDEHPRHTFTYPLGAVAPYVPGQFYQRELPALLAGLKQVDLSTLHTLVVDGHVYVNNHGDFGLGGHLWKALDERIPVIGVAKSHFQGNDHYTAELRRGNSQRPLYISAVGMPLTEAVDAIRRMHGTYRIPTLLKQLDQLSRTPPPKT